MPPEHDRVLGGLIAQIRPAGHHLGGCDRHRRVVGPFAGLPHRTTTHVVVDVDLDVGAQRGSELERRA